MRKNTTDKNEINLLQDFADYKSKIKGTDLDAPDCFFGFMVTYQNILEMKNRAEKNIAKNTAKLLLESGFSAKTASLSTKLSLEEITELQDELQCETV